MSYFSIFFIAVALGVDAFVASISCGIKIQDLKWDKFGKIALMFGFFQAGMPLLGWGLGQFVAPYISPYTALLSFGVFFALGVKTLKDTYTEEEETCNSMCSCNKWSCLLSLAVATSIDAFLVGVVFSVKQVSLPTAILIIGLVTFVMSLVGCTIGHHSVSKLGKKAGWIAGFMLIGLAVYQFL